jgi:hypothetical protein
MNGQGEITIFELIKGHFSEVPEAIWLVVELGRVIMPLNIFPKFHDDLTTTI